MKRLLLTPEELLPLVCVAIPDPCLLSATSVKDEWQLRHYKEDHLWPGKVPLVKTSARVPTTAPLSVLAPICSMAGDLLPYVWVLSK